MKQLGRIERAVEIGEVTTLDFEDLLEPVRVRDPASPTGYDLVRPLTTEKVKEVIRRAKLLADRADVPDETFNDIQIDEILRREIELGASQGGF